MIDLDVEGLDAARKVAYWHLGDSSWAYLIVSAYVNPEQALADLADEMGEDN